MGSKLTLRLDAGSAYRSAHNQRRREMTRARPRIGTTADLSDCVSVALCEDVGRVDQPLQVPGNPWVLGTPRHR
jgi:hypothetical protein